MRDGSASFVVRRALGELVPTSDGSKPAIVTALEANWAVNADGCPVVRARRWLCHCASGDTGEMGHRSDPPELIWLNAPEAFGFLAEQWGFEGPERTSGGVAYHRAGLHIMIEFVAWNHEAEFLTRLSMTGANGQELQASLGCLYLASGAGNAAAVPTSAVLAGHTIIKRIGQHAAALRRVMPHLDGSGAAELFRRCQRRELPVS
jgi:hypothetical protein